MVHRKILLADSLEFKKAKTFCFRNSKYDHKRQERIFTATPEDVVNFVHIAVEDPIEEWIPETPQGLVLADNRCTGAFQQIE
jgi:hypothetical protein